MSPRALTDQEKEFQRQKILAKAKDLILNHGVKKVSVDDMIKAAGVGKATFYNHFAGKETLLMQLVWEIYQDFLTQAKRLIQDSSAEKLRQNVGAFLRSILHDREKVFFFINHRELEDLIASLKTEEIRDFNQLECQAFESLILLAGLDVDKVKPGEQC